VVADLDGLTQDQQHQLQHWLDTRPRHVQVISVSATPVFALVQRGTFSNALFYRLNTVRVA